MDEYKRAYQALLKGIKQYIRDTVNKYADRTYTGLIKSVSVAEDNTYIVNINGVEYPNVPTIGGTCNPMETVKVMIPQGNFTNMFILKSGNGSNGSQTIDISAETENIDFSNMI